MKKVIGILSAAALALGVFLAVNSVSPENNSEVSLSSLTSLATADAACVNGLNRTKRQAVYITTTCEDGEGNSYTCRKFSHYTTVPDPIANNGECLNGNYCWTGEGAVYNCYTR